MLKHRPEIDGLRALAVLPVIFFHAGFEWFSGGYTGVDVFFVISGYLITSIIIRELAEGRFSIINFYGRRARRILPALFLVTAASIPFALMWLPGPEKRDFAESLIAVSVFSSNVLFARESGYFAGAAEFKPLLHTWSLAVEEQYYILFPLFMAAMWRFARKAAVPALVILFCVSLGAAELQNDSNPADAFYLLHTRGWEILLGAFCAFYLQKNGPPKSVLSGPLAALGLALIAFAVFAYGETTPVPGLYTLAPVLGAALIILFARKGGVTGNILGCRPLAGVGLISYSAYLWHHPLLVFYKVRFSWDDPFAPLTVTALIAFVFVLSFFTWKYVETPFRKTHEPRRRKKLAWSALAAAVLFAALGGAGHYAFPKRLKQEQIEAGGVTVPAPKWPNFFSQDGKRCSARSFEGAGPCRFKGGGGGGNVVLIGDSHAEILAEPLYNARGEFGAFLVLSSLGCPFLPGMNIYQHALCDAAYQAQRRAFIQSLPGQTTFILAARLPLYYHRENFENGKGRTEPRRLVFAYQKTGAGAPPDAARKKQVLESIRESVTFLSSLGRVVIIYPSHVNGWDPVITAPMLSIAGKNYQEIERYLEIPVSAVQSWTSDVETVLDELAAANDRVYKIDPKDFTCGESVCRSLQNGRFLFLDSNHLAPHINEMIVREILLLGFPGAAPAD